MPSNRNSSMKQKPQMVVARAHREGEREREGEDKGGREGRTKGGGRGRRVEALVMCGWADVLLFLFF